MKKLLLITVLAILVVAATAHKKLEKRFVKLLVQGKS